MDVLRRVKALRRRPEKLVEDSLSADCGALHLHHPAWYSGNNNIKDNVTVTKLGSPYADIDELDLLSLSVKMPTATTTTTTMTSKAASSSSASLSSKWNPQLQQILRKSNKIRLPKEMIRMRRKTANNEVFRSNSFKFEKYDVGDEDGGGQDEDEAASQRFKHRITASSTQKQVGLIL